jgi:hypothetical protein
MPDRDPSDLTMELRPWREGAYTQVSLRGVIATVAQPKEMRCLLKVLSWWSGAPVDLALCVDGTSSGSCWLEVWDDVLLHIRGRHLFRARFVVSRGTLATGMRRDR